MISTVRGNLLFFLLCSKIAQMQERKLNKTGSSFLLQPLGSSFSKLPPVGICYFPESPCIYICVCALTVIYLILLLDTNGGQWFILYFLTLYLSHFLKAAYFPIVYLGCSQIFCHYKLCYNLHAMLQLTPLFLLENLYPFR